MKNVQISFTTSPELRKNSTIIAHKLGMSLSTILNMCLTQLNYQRGLPFPTNLPKRSLPEPIGDKELNRRLDKVTKGNYGKKHHLIE